MLSIKLSCFKKTNQHTNQIDLPTCGDRKIIKIFVGKHLQFVIQVVVCRKNQVWSRLTISLVYPLVSGDFYAFSFSVTNPSVAGGGGSGSRFVFFWVVKGWLKRVEFGTRDIDGM